jgi:hypothetical protein
MSNVQQLLESAAGSWKSLQSDAAKLAGKWAKTGLLEGLVEMDKNNMSLLLENQAKQLVTEVNTIASNSFYTSGGQGENWAGIALPLVRKVFGTIVAKEFVSVQPMNMPSGLVFFLDFQYGNNKTPFTAGSSLYGNRDTASQFPFSTPAPVGGLYGGPEGRFTYATNQFSASALITGSANGAALPATVASGTGTVVTASWSELNFDSDYSASAAANQVYKLTLTTASVLRSFDQDAVRGFVPSGSGDGGTFAPANLLSAFTTYNYTAGTIAFFFTGSSTVAAGLLSGSVTYFYQKSTSQDGINVTSGNNEASSATNSSGRGDFEDQGPFATPNAAGANIDIPEINVKMQSQPITAKTKKLKAVWTPEFAQDLAAYQNIDAEAELTNIMSEYISMEIDLEILDMLIEDAAAATEYWSAVNNTTYSNGAFSTNSATAFYNTQGQWFQTLGTKIQKVSNKIHQLTLRGGANFLVTSPTIATILESIPGFASTNNGEADQMEYAFGVQKIGTVNGRYKVYKNPYMTENLILMGYRGSQFLETGAVFAPYIPLIMTPLVYDPDTFTPRKGLLTRYAKKMLRPEFYGKIYISGLNTI